jgi:hypothetical protein
MPVTNHATCTSHACSPPSRPRHERDPQSLACPLETNPRVAWRMVLGASSRAEGGEVGGGKASSRQWSPAQCASSGDMPSMAGCERVHDMGTCTTMPVVGAQDSMHGLVFSYIHASPAAAAASAGGGCCEHWRHQHSVVASHASYD